MSLSGAGTQVVQKSNSTAALLSTDLPRELTWPVRTWETQMRLSELCSICAGLAAIVCAQVVCASDEAPFVRAELQRFTASVASVDTAERKVALVGPAGEHEVFVVGPDVRNLDQIKVGDRVILSYYEALVAEIKPPGTPAEGTQSSSDAQVAPLGARPAASADRILKTTVKIASIDTSSNTVTFTREDGITRTIAVADPKARKFMHGLKTGDSVEITYREATAVSVQPVQR
jgi:hypothetical protein